MVETNEFELKEIRYIWRRLSYTNNHREKDTGWLVWKKFCYS